MKKVIVNADDFGISHEVNMAICKCFKDKIINRTTIMINMPHAQEAIEMANRYGFADKVGLHLNLVEGRPITDSCMNTPLCDKDGNFTKMLVPGVLNRFWLNRGISNAIAIETEAQIKSYLDSGLTLKHLDSHYHAHTNWSVYRVIKPVISQYGFGSIRISRNIPPKDISLPKQMYKYILHKHLISGHSTHYMGTQDDFSNTLNTVDDKITEIMIHPMFNSGGELTDSYEKIQISDWLNQNKIVLI